MANRFYGETPVLVWWAECVDLFDRLTSRNRARALSLLADGIRRRADRGFFPNGSVDRLWQHSSRAPARTWRCVEPELEMRIIG